MLETLVYRLFLNKRGLPIVGEETRGGAGGSLMVVW